MIHSMSTKHVYEHDVESLFWVVMWVVFCCGNKPLAPECPLDCPLLTWDKVDRVTFVRRKARFWDCFLASDRFIKHQNSNRGEAMGRTLEDCP